MKNTDLLYESCLKYQNGRKSAVDAYEARLKELETARGSQLYETETKKAAEARDNAITSLRTEAQKSIDTALKYMSEANLSRGMKPPTDEQLRLLQLLKLKENVTATDLSRAAVALKDNADCLAVVQELADKAGILGSFTKYAANQEMNAQDAEQSIRGVASTIRDFLQYDTADGARRTTETRERLYGKNPDAPPLPKRPLFNDKAAFYADMSHDRLKGDRLTAFSKAVDGE